MALDIGRMQKNAIQIIARLFIGNCELGLINQPLKIGGSEAESMAEIACSEVGKSLSGKDCKLNRERPERNCNWPCSPFDSSET